MSLFLCCSFRVDVKLFGEGVPDGGVDDFADNFQLHVICGIYCEHISYRIQQLEDEASFEEEHQDTTGSTERKDSLLGA